MRSLWASLSWPRRLAVPVAVAVYAACVWRWGFDARVPLLYAGASLLAFGVYGWDKGSARQGSERVPERSLHAIDVLGGWPGALLAQQWFRHKTRKSSFIAMFWLTVAVNLMALVAWHAGGGALLGAWPAFR